MSRRVGIPFVISGPSGAGKSTLLRLVLLADPNIRFSVSHTTRDPRPGEQNGRDYWFVDRKTFQEMIDANAFLEWAEYQDKDFPILVDTNIFCRHISPDGQQFP